MSSMPPGYDDPNLMAPPPAPTSAPAAPPSDLASSYPAPPVPTTPPALPVPLPPAPFNITEPSAIPGSADVGFSSSGFQQSPAGPPSNDEELLQHILGGLPGRG